MTQSEAWMIQVQSDQLAGHTVFNAQEAATFCQAISKYQQVVEKSIKAMVAALTESGVAAVNIGSDHYPEKQIDALLLIKRAIGQDLIAQIRAVFSPYRLGEIRALCLLAPRLPPRRNTEYPYPDGQGGWTAPAVQGSFTAAEVYRFRRLSDQLVPIVGRFVQSVRLRPR